jgi:hypothetical protein
VKTALATAAGCAALLLLAPAPARAELSIADLAPREAILAGAVPDCAAFREAIDRSMLGAMWRDPAIRPWVESLWKDDSPGSPGADLKEFRAALERAGVDEDDLAWPSGLAGGALWFVRGTEDPVPVPRAFLVADFADKAPAMRAAFTAMVDELEETDETVAVERSEHAGADVWRFTITPAGVPEALANEDFQDPDAPDAGEGDEDLEWDVFEPEPEVYFFAWSGAVAVLATDRPALEHALDRLEGVAGESLADHPDFDRTLAQIDASQAFVYAAIAPAVAFMIENTLGALDPAGAEGPRAVADALGVGALRAAAMGLRLDGPGGAMEQSIAVLAPEKSGVIALFDGRIDSFTPPPSVGADATTLVMLHFNYEQLFPTLNRVVASIPDEELRQQAQLSLGFITGGLAPLTAAMSPETVVTSAIARPFTTEPDPTTLSVGVKDAEAIKAGVQTMAPMLQFEARDFQGNQLWESPMGAALGLGFGRIFVGPTQSVENALRQAGEGQALRLAAEPRFQRAASFVKPGAMLYVYTDIVTTMEKSIYMVRNMRAVMTQQLEEQGWSREEIDQIVETMEEDPWERFAKATPPVEVFARYLSDSVFELHSTPEGFRGRSLTLPPAN